MYGRNAMGGVINIITRQPEPGKGVEVFGETTVANYGQQRILSETRIPLYQNKLHFGAAGLYDRGDGFYVNEFDQSNYEEHLDFSGNYFLQYFLNEHRQTSLNFKHFTNKNGDVFPLVLGTEEAFDNPYRLNQNETSTMVDNTLNASLAIDYRGLNLNFSSQTSYQRNYRYYNGPMDADFSPLDAISIFNNYGSDWNNVEVLTQELRFSSPDHRNSRMNWTAGTCLFLQKNPVRQATRIGEDAGLLG